MVSLTSAPLRYPDCLGTMLEDIKHRGPDARGTWSDTHAAIGVARLRIRDLHIRSDQPLVFPDRVIACNGEIDNAEELGRRPRSSDIATLEPLLDNPTKALSRVDGMFAIASWARLDRTLTLARDSNGEKPMFVLEAEGELWFASEIGPLLRHPGVRDAPVLDHAALRDYLLLGYFPEPATPYAAIRKLRAGYVLTAGPDRPPRTARFEDPIREPLPIERAITRATASQAANDVATGVFLSGGIDSGLLTALLMNSGSGRIKTFSVGFEDSRYDETTYAGIVAQHLGTRHFHLTATTDDLVETADTVAAEFSEPLADPALLPTHLLAGAARAEVGVVLSGEGADELFGGYPTYIGHSLLHQRGVARLAGLVRPLFRTARASTGRVTNAWLADRFAAHARESGPSRHVAWTGWGFAGLVDVETRAEAARRLYGPIEDWTVRTAMDMDRQLSLRDSLLVKLDRATMTFGLEARAPYLSPWTRNAASALGQHELVRRSRTKVALHRAACGHLPDAILRRRKQGLSVPIASLLNGALADRVESIFSSHEAELITDLFPEVSVSELLRHHRSGHANHARPLWTVFTLLNWLAHWRHQTA